MFVLVIYDVSDNKRRHRLHRELKNVAEPVQYSAFEGELASKPLQGLCRRMEAIVDPSEDGVRVYRLCRECREKARIIGRGEPTEYPEVVLV